MARIPKPLITQALKLKPTKGGVALGAAGAAGTAAASKATGSHSATGEQRKAGRADNISAGLAGAGTVAGTTAYAAKKGALGAKVGSKIGHMRPGRAMFALSTGAALVAAHHVMKRDSAQGVSGTAKAKDVAKAGAGLGVTSTPPQPKVQRSLNKGKAVAKGRAPSKPSSF
jgi:hypothetical protein